jgi:hypothetical protein
MKAAPGNGSRFSFSRSKAWAFNLKQWGLIHAEIGRLNLLD